MNYVIIVNYDPPVNRDYSDITDVLICLNGRIFQSSVHIGNKIITVIEEYYKPSFVYLPNTRKDIDYKVMSKEYPDFYNYVRDNPYKIYWHGVPSVLGEHTYSKFDLAFITYKYVRDLDFITSEKDLTRDERYYAIDNISKFLCGKDKRIKDVNQCDCECEECECDDYILHQKNMIAAFKKYYDPDDNLKIRLHRDEDDDGDQHIENLKLSVNTYDAENPEFPYPEYFATELTNTELGGTIFYLDENGDEKYTRYGESEY